MILGGREGERGGRGGSERGRGGREGNYCMSALYGEEHVTLGGVQPYISVTLYQHM